VPLNYGKMKPVVAKVLRKNAQGNHRGTTRIMTAIFIPVSNHVDSISTSDLVNK